MKFLEDKIKTYKDEIKDHTIKCEECETNKEPCFIISAKIYKLNIVNERNIEFNKYRSENDFILNIKELWKENNVKIINVKDISITDKTIHFNITYTIVFEIADKSISVPYTDNINEIKHRIKKVYIIDNKIHLICNLSNSSLN